MRTSVPVDVNAEAVWAHLARRWWDDPDKIASQRENIAWRVPILASLLKCQPEVIYAALAVGVQFYGTERARLRDRRNEATVRKMQGRVLHDVERALASVEEWGRRWGYSPADVEEMLEPLRTLRSEFQEVPIPLDAAVPKPKMGHPWASRNYTARLLDRLHVPPQERQELLAALGLI